jgi:hypothetical protein
MTGRIRLLAWIYLVMCGIALAVGAVVLIGLLLSRDPQRDSALLFVGPLFLAMAALFFLPGVIGGLGLLGGKAWARAIIITLSFLIIFLFPVGTALGGFGLWVLLGPEGERFRHPGRPEQSKKEAEPTTSAWTPPADAPAIEPNADAIPRLRDRISELARLIEAPDHVLPTFGYSEDSGRPHIEVDGAAFHYVLVDRGREYARFSTTLVDDLLYRVFRDATFSMAATQLAVNQVTWLARRRIFRRQLELLGRLDPSWASRRRAER